MQNKHPGAQGTKTPSLQAAVDSNKLNRPTAQRGSGRISGTSTAAKREAGTETRASQGNEMGTITITVQGEEYESLNIELTSEEVTALYKLRKEQSQRIQELEKELGDTQKNKKYAEDSRDSAKSELDQAHTLLTALGIPDKTSHEESYYRKDLHISTRIALYIAKATGA